MPVDQQYSPDITPADGERVGAMVEDGSVVGDGGAGLVFWLLILMAVATFAPCVILPAWRDYQQQELTLRLRARQVAQLEAETGRLRRELDAVHNDPAAIARLAQRDLEYRRPGETVLAVGHFPSSSQSPTRLAALLEPAPAEASPSVAPAPAPAAAPAALVRWERYLPQWDYDELFCRNPCRRILLGLSLALFVSAFVIFWPRPWNEEPALSTDV